MPYIPEDFRPEVYASSARVPQNAGELNYQITMLLHAYMDSNGTNYQNMNDVMGALVGAQAEFYRRIAAPYEDIKIQENGDV